MAGFEVVESPQRTIWAPVDYNSTTLYVGQLVVAGGVASSMCGAVKAWNPAGLADTTADQVPFGVVVGTDNKTPLYSSTYSAEYVTGVQSQANLTARSYFGKEGSMYAGDPQACVQVAVLSPETILKGRIYNNAWGTAPTVLTVTTGSTTGAGFTANAAEHTPVAYNATVYCRSGANRGLYRVTTDTSTTVRTVNHYFPYDIAVGDTFVSVNLNALGPSYAMTDTAGTYFNNSAAVTTTNYIWIDVLELHLETAGDEHVIFRINPIQYAAVRA